MDIVWFQHDPVHWTFSMVVSLHISPKHSKHSIAAVVVKHESKISLHTSIYRRMRARM